MNYQERFIVQDLETFEFLFPDIDGGIGQTPYLSLAGKYDYYQDALEAGVEEIGGEFTIFRFFEAVPS